MRLLLIAAGAAALLAAPQAHAAQGDVLVRLRAITVAPQESSSPIEPAFPGSYASVNTSYAPELDFTYMATDHLGVELILATTKHDIYGRGSLGGFGKLASTWVLPPTLTLQYHLAPSAKIRPYVGVGVNETIFYSEKASGKLRDAIGPTSVHLRSSFGYALQAGVDISLTSRIFLNADVKYIDIDTRARLNTGGAINRTSVSLDPIVAGIGIGLRI